MGNVPKSVRVLLDRLRVEDPPRGLVYVVQEPGTEKDWLSWEKAVADAKRDVMARPCESPDEAEQSSLLATITGVDQFGKPVTEQIEMPAQFALDSCMRKVGRLSAELEEKKAIIREQHGTTLCPKCEQAANGNRTQTFNGQPFAYWIGLEEKVRTLETRLAEARKQSDIYRKGEADAHESYVMCLERITELEAYFAQQPNKSKAEPVRVESASSHLEQANAGSASSPSPASPYTREQAKNIAMCHTPEGMPHSVMHEIESRAPASPALMPIENCPFCGVNRDSQSRIHYAGQRYAWRCWHCLAQGPVVVRIDNDGPIIAAWNKRAPGSAPNNSSARSHQPNGTSESEGDAYVVRPPTATERQRIPQTGRVVDDAVETRASIESKRRDGVSVDADANHDAAVPLPTAPAPSKPGEWTAQQVKELIEIVDECEPDDVLMPMEHERYMAFCHGFTSLRTAISRTLRAKLGEKSIFGVLQPKRSAPVHVAWERVIEDYCGDDDVSFDCQTKLRSALAAHTVDAPSRAGVPNSISAPTERLWTMVWSCEDKPEPSVIKPFCPYCDESVIVQDKVQAREWCVNHSATCGKHPAFIANARAERAEASQ